MQAKPKHKGEYVRGFITKAIHTGYEGDTDTGAIVPPIHVSSTYEVYSEVPPVLSHPPLITFT